MEEDDPSSILAERSQRLETLISHLSSSASKLSGRARAVPAGKDFHFYNNFPEFKLPGREASSKAQSSLASLSSASTIFGARPPPPPDLDDSYDWLVGLNDEFIERLNVSLDEFKQLREEEEGRAGSALEEGGFQVVRSKKSKRSGMDKLGKEESSVKMGLKDQWAAGGKGKMPFHNPAIPRPQDEYRILVNNTNKPFEHVWLERSEDGSLVHPLEKASVEDFIDRGIEEVQIDKPLPLESTPFKLVEEVKHLKELAARLRNVNEFAVDLEHNHYRSFQGITCLMQISTRTEDFIIDTLKLRIHIGPYLREVFKDPSKRKVMHGADRDIEWLQRDFSIYVCNLFDTGQASRVLKLERNSLEHLLQHFCEMKANKEYQNADWRLRPLPDEMIKYAREDTHYLLHIYDLMRQRLLSASSNEDDLLLEVYKRSYNVCTRLYQKEILTDTSFLHTYGLQEANFNAKQLSVASELYAWRDKIARDEDESTGFILPNKALLDIAREAPLSPTKLRRMVNPKHSMVERNLSTICNLIRHAVGNSSSFENTAEELKKAHLESLRQKAEETGTNSEVGAVVEDARDSSESQGDLLSGKSVNVEGENTGNSGSGSGSKCHEEKLQLSSPPGCSSNTSSTAETMEGAKMDYQKADLETKQKLQVSKSSVQISKKQTSSFGGMFGHSASKRKSDPGTGGPRQEDKNVNKVEQIKSQVILPFYSFGDKAPGASPSMGIKQPQPETPPRSNQPTSQLEEVILLENDDHDRTEEPSTAGHESPEVEALEEEPMTLSDLSSSFQQFVKTNGSTDFSRQSREPELKIRVQPFDYAAARKNTNFGGGENGRHGGSDDGKPPESGGKRRAASIGQDNGERVRGLRRQAFPPSGNRSATYK